MQTAKKSNKNIYKTLKNQLHANINFKNDIYSPEFHKKDRKIFYKLYKSSEYKIK